MIELATTSVSKTNSTPAEISSVDLLLSIEIMLVKDYDSQLVSLRNQIKGQTEVKKRYRSEIEKFQEMLTRPSKKIGDKEYVSCTGTEIRNDLNNRMEVVSQEDKKNPGLMDPQIRNLPVPKKDQIEMKEPVYAKERVYNPKTKKYEEKENKDIVISAQVPKDAIEKIVEIYKIKLDSVNEQSEIMSINIQSLMNQRKVAFETVSNLMSKFGETLNTIVRNIKG